MVVCGPTPGWSPQAPLPKPAAGRPRFPPGGEASLHRDCGDRLASQAPFKLDLDRQVQPLERPVVGRQRGTPASSWRVGHLARGTFFNPQLTRTMSSLGLSRFLTVPESPFVTRSSDTSRQSRNGRGPKCGSAIRNIRGRRNMQLASNAFLLKRTQRTHSDQQY